MGQRAPASFGTRFIQTPGETRIALPAAAEG